MKFFEFKQNNSGGRFDFVEKSGLTVHVIIEANDAEDANDRAKRIGIYFDGCANGFDCSCCGDRWDRMYPDDTGDDEPKVYGIPLEKYKPYFKRIDGGKEVAVHYADGRIAWHIYK